jgi:hypothetical protein
VGSYSGCSSAGEGGHCNAGFAHLHVILAWRMGGGGEEYFQALHYPEQPYNGCKGRRCVNNTYVPTSRWLSCTYDRVGLATTASQHCCMKPSWNVVHSCGGLIYRPQWLHMPQECITIQPAVHYLATLKPKP